MSTTTPLTRFRNSKAKQKLNQWTKSAFSDRIFVTLLLLWVLPILATSTLVAINLSNLPQTVPLFYNRIWGEPQLSRNYFLFLPLGGAFLLGVFNLGLAINFHGKDRVFSYLLAGSALLVTALATLTVTNIIRLFL